MKVQKYDGLGNTFSIIMHEKDQDFSQIARKICNNEKLKTDGLIVVKKEPTLEMIFHNQDGSYAPMCGNGIRAFAKYLIDNKIKDTNEFEVKTGSGFINVAIIDKNPFLCKINMGEPKFTPKHMKLSDENSLKRTIDINGQKIDINMVFMGTIHTVVFVDDATKYVDNVLGEKICNHEIFTEKTNVNFVSINSKKNITVRTYERGVGYTKACGTGCCAALVIANQLGFVEEKAIVELELGELIIEQKQKDIYMTGPAKFHFEIEIMGVADD